MNVMRRAGLSSSCAAVAALLGSSLLFQSGRGEERVADSPAAAETVVQRIEELGGVVRYLSARGKSLEVDFQFSGEQLADEHLECLSALGNVVALRLKRTAVTDTGMAQVGKIHSLRRLYLEETQITDRGLIQLSSLPELEFLNLYGTAVTDRGIRRLGTLPRLAELFIGETPVTQAGVVALRKVAPQIKVIPDRAEDRRRAEVFLQSAVILLGDAEDRLEEAEQSFRELDPQKDELKKAKEEADKLAAERRGQADELAKQRAAATKLVEERQREADEVTEKAREKPNDEQLQRAKEERLKALAEARVRASEASLSYDESHKEADAASAKAALAKAQSDRANQAGGIQSQAKKVLEGARSRLGYAQRDVCFPFPGKLLIPYGRLRLDYAQRGMRFAE